MAIISFWSNEKGETGKTAAIAATTTYLAINYNYKILIIDTKYNDYSYQDCYWKDDKRSKLMSNDNGKTNIASGTSGLVKAILSNKTAPEIITNYTKTVFSENRLEVLTDEKVIKEDYETNKKAFKEIAKIANKYYDLVFIDIDTNLDDDIKNAILDISDLIIANMSQKLRHIDNYINIRQNNSVLKDKPIIPLLGRYDKNSKYNVKNVARYIKQKDEICIIPYNTLFFEACNEGTVADYFIKFRKINPKDKNALFLEEVKHTAEKIISKLRKLQMKV